MRARVLVGLGLLTACGARTPMGVDDDTEAATKSARARLVMITNAGELALSDDGVSWRPGPTLDTPARALATDDDGRLVLIDRNVRSFVSTDGGDHWKRGAIVEDSAHVMDVGWDGEQFVAAGVIVDASNRGVGSYAATSRDGLGWTTIPGPAGANPQEVFRTLGGVRIASAHEGSGHAVYELRGGAWQELAPNAMIDPGAPRGIMDAAYVPALNATYAVTNDRKLWSTTDGNTWTRHHLPESFESMYAGDYPYAVAAAGDQVAVLAQSGVVVTSRDAQTWTARRTADGRTWSTQLAFGGGRFYVAGFINLDPNPTGAVVPPGTDTARMVAAASSGTTWTTSESDRFRAPIALVYVGR